MPMRLQSLRREHSPESERSRLRSRLPAGNSARESLGAISALVGAGVIDSSLKYHIATAKKNGVTKDEMVEMITQLGFYAGWPKAWAAFRMAKEVYADETK